MLAVRVIALLLMVLLTPLGASASEKSACREIDVQHYAQSDIGLGFIVGLDQTADHEVAPGHCSDGWICLTQNAAVVRQPHEEFRFVDAADISGTDPRPEIGPPRTILA